MPYDYSEFEQDGGGGVGVSTPAPPAPLQRVSGVAVAHVALPKAPPLITAARELDQVLPALCAAPLVGVDTETTGLDPLTDRLRLVQCAVPGGPAVAVDVWQVPVQLLEPIFTTR